MPCHPEIDLFTFCFATPNQYATNTESTFLPDLIGYVWIRDREQYGDKPLGVEI